MLARYLSLSSVVMLLLLSCQRGPEYSPKVPEGLLQYVNPFIGTGGHGHTFPGATMPFGMMQLSPDTRLDGWDGCGGYHYSDSYLFGFSHTHLSGTGVSDYGDVLLMPVREPIFNNGADGKRGYGSHFSHERENAFPGYYAVYLDDPDVQAELTTSYRSGFHRYQYSSASNQFVILDLAHRDKVLSSAIEVLDDHNVRGHRRSAAWARDQRLFYHLRFSHPIAEVHYAEDGKDLKAVFEFKNPKNEPVEVQVGISAVDEAGALKNLEAEVAEKSFEEVRRAAGETWQRQLEKIDITTSDADRKRVFYTALYHTMLAPNLYQDTDGRYRGMDLEVHQNADFDYYTVFSLWDTYRATHPLFTIIEQERTNDFVKTLLAKFNEGGIMPIWDLSANYTGCMIGYHGVSVIADAYLKGIRDYDADLALKAMQHSANQDHLGLKSYKKLGFIPVEEESESVSKTLEYAYDDWCIAAMAREMGREEVYQEFIERACNYRNVFDPSSGFMRGRNRNTWFAPFDPFEVNFNYTEANAWQYNLYVPQDIAGHIELLGGPSAYEAHLDKLFTVDQETAGRQQADITGLIGQYAHGNEPSHHMAYLYNYVQRPDKTQQRVHQILTSLYSNSPDGISGNEDCGQMSAWYVLSALGFYPVTPGSPVYSIGSPLVESATIHLENGKDFTVEAAGVQTGLSYIKAVSLNGKSINRSYITHQEIMEGGVLSFEMSDTPTEWATEANSVPPSSISGAGRLGAPFITTGDLVFSDSTLVELAHHDPEAKIYYQFSQGPEQLYVGPILIDSPGDLSVFARMGDQVSPVVKTAFHKVVPGMSVELFSEYANEYSAGGPEALIDGIFGTRDFRTGAWQGYQNQDVAVEVNLGKAVKVQSVGLSFLQDQQSWIFLPLKVVVKVSTDGDTWTDLATRELGPVKQDGETRIFKMKFDNNLGEISKIRIEATTVGKLPDWHLGYSMDGTAWIFMDEIEVMR